MSRDPRKDRARKRRLRRREAARVRNAKARLVASRRFSLADFDRAIKALLDLPRMPGQNDVIGYGVMTIGGIKRRGYMTGDMVFWETDAVPDCPYRELPKPLLMGVARELFHWLPTP